MDTAYLTRKEPKNTSTNNTKNNTNTITTSFSLVKKGKKWGLRVVCV